MTSRGKATVVVAMLTTTLLAGCSSSGSSTASGPPLTFEQGSAALLTASDLPAGYTASVLTASEAAQPLPSDIAEMIASPAAGPCAPQNELEDMTEELLSLPTVRFDGGGRQSGPPALYEAIYTGPEAKKLVDLSKRMTSECAKWKTGADAIPEEGEAGDEHQTNVVLPFPSLGDDSAAYTQGLLYTEGSTDPAESAESDIVIVRRGDAAILLSRSLDEDSKGTALPLEEFARKALAKYDAARAASMSSATPKATATTR